MYCIDIKQYTVVIYIIYKSNIDYNIYFEIYITIHTHTHKDV